MANKGDYSTLGSFAARNARKSSVVAVVHSAIDWTIQITLDSVAGLLVQPEGYFTPRVDSNHSISTYTMLQ